MDNQINSPLLLILLTYTYLFGSIRLLQWKQLFLIKNEKFEYFTYDCLTHEIRRYADIIG